jgi:endonuclease IV
MRVKIPKINEKQYSIIREEVKNEFAKHIDKYNREAVMQVIHILHFEFGFGQKRLQQFADLLCEMQSKQKERYEMPDQDVPFICETQLKQSGVDIDELLGG